MCIRDRPVSVPNSVSNTQAAVSPGTDGQRTRSSVSSDLDDLKRAAPSPVPASLCIAERFDAATVMFADIVGFTEMSSHVSPAALVALLDTVFTRFDALAVMHGMEKIKTIGDAYMATAGVPYPCPDHAQRAADMALSVVELLHSGTFRKPSSLNVHHSNSENGHLCRNSAASSGSHEDSEPIDCRIGLHSGPVVAGVIGRTKFIYDLWGDAVNTASRMESHGVPGCIQVSEATYKLLLYRLEGYVFEDRGYMAIKGKGFMRTYILTHKEASNSVHVEKSPTAVTPRVQAPAVLQESRCIAQLACPCPSSDAAFSVESLTGRGDRVSWQANPSPGLRSRSLSVRSLGCCEQSNTAVNHSDIVVSHSSLLPLPAAATLRRRSVSTVTTEVRNAAESYPSQALVSEKNLPACLPPPQIGLSALNPLPFNAGTRCMHSQVLQSLMFLLCADLARAKNERRREKVRRPSVAVEILQSTASSAVKCRVRSSSATPPRCRP